MRITTSVSFSVSPTDAIMLLLLLSCLLMLGASSAKHV